MSDLVRRVREHLPLGQQTQPEAQHWLNDRPGALFAAGSVGTRRVPARSERQQPSRPGPPGFVESADAPTAEERPRRQASQATIRQLRATPRGRIILALHSPSAVRQAMVLREVLDPPVALRGEAASR